MSGAGEFFELAVDFEKASARTAITIFGIYKKAGSDFAEAWADNARRHFTSHAAKYPDSITSETRLAFGIEVETGPEDSASNQGFLGRILELGGERSPAYMDGQRALAPADVKLTREADEALRGIVP